MTINLRALRAMAEKATPGKWFSDKARPDGFVSDQDVVRSSIPINACTDVIAVCNRDAAFIAAASPSTIIALLDVVESLQKFYNLKNGSCDFRFEFDMRRALAALEAT